MATPSKARGVRAGDGWQPVAYRATAPSGTIWAEASDEAEVRAMARPDDTLETLWRRQESEWRPAVEPTPEVAERAAAIRELHEQEPVSCYECGGSGSIWEDDGARVDRVDCERCGGTGEIE